MAKLQRDDAKNLWEQMGQQHSWKALVGVLEGHVEKSQGIEDSTVRALLCEARDFQRADEDFPESASKLLEYLNQRIENYRDCAEGLKKDVKAEKSTGGQARAESGKKSGKSEQKKGEKKTAAAAAAGGSPRAKAQKSNGQKEQKSSGSKRGKSGERRSESAPRSEDERRSGGDRRAQSESGSEKTTQTGGGRYDDRSDFRSQDQPAGWVGSGASEDWVEGELSEAGEKQGTQRKQSSQQNQNSQPDAQSQADQKAQPQDQGEKRMIRLTTSDPEQLHTLYKRGNFKTWDEMIAWLHQRTQGDNPYPEDMVQAMIEDLETLKAHGAKLNDHGEQSFRLVRGKVIE